MKKKSEKEKYSPLSFFFISFAAHGLVIFLIFQSERFWSFFDRESQVVLPPALRVDMVALPDLPSQSKPAEAKKRPIAWPKKEKKKIKRKKKLKTKSKQEKRQNKPSAQDNKAKSAQKKLNKGNRLAEGEDKGQEALDAQKMEIINKYFMGIEDRIKSNWGLPKHLMDLNLKAQIEIRINDRGELMARQLLFSSNNDLFDSYVLKAAENAAPYPPPPADVKNLLRDGVVLTLTSQN